MTLKETFIHEVATLEATIVKLKTVIDLFDKPTEQNTDFLQRLNGRLVKVNDLINYYESFKIE